MFHPVHVRALAGLVDEDLDHVPVAERVLEGDAFLVDLGGDGGVADVRMDGVGKVDAGAVFRQVDDIALRGENEDAVAEDVDLEVFEGADVFLFVCQFLLDIGQFADPARDVLLRGLELAFIV